MHNERCTSGSEGGHQNPTAAMPHGADARPYLPKDQRAPPENQNHIFAQFHRRRRLMMLGAESSETAQPTGESG